MNRHLLPLLPSKMRIHVVLAALAVSMGWWCAMPECAVAAERASRRYGQHVETRTAPTESQRRTATSDDGLARDDTVQGVATEAVEELPSLVDTVHVLGDEHPVYAHAIWRRYGGYYEKRKSVNVPVPIVPIGYPFGYPYGVGYGFSAYARPWYSTYYRPWYTWNAYRPWYTYNAYRPWYTYGLYQPWYSNYYNPYYGYNTYYGPSFAPYPSMFNNYYPLPYADYRGCYYW